MASLPAIRSGSLTQGQLEALIDALDRGEHPLAIAKRLQPTDKKAQRRVRRQLEAHCLQDGRVAAGIVNKSKLTLMVGLGPATKALVGRAGRMGKPDAVKLVFEASGFHNPRVQHEHSGEITIKLDMPRPKFEADGAIDTTSVEDADVVD